MSTALGCRGTEHKVATRSLTRKEPGGDSGRKRSLCAAVDAGEELEEQPVFCHGVDHTGHGKHGAQQAAVGRDSSGLAGWWPDKPSRLHPPSSEGKDQLVLGAGQELHRAQLGHVPPALRWGRRHHGWGWSYLVESAQSEPTATA